MVQKRHPEVANIANHPNTPCLEAAIQGTPSQDSHFQIGTNWRPGLRGYLKRTNQQPPALGGNMRPGLRRLHKNTAHAHPLGFQPPFLQNIAAEKPAERRLVCSTGEGEGCSTGRGGCFTGGGCVVNSLQEASRDLKPKYFSSILAQTISCSKSSLLLRDVNQRRVLAFLFAST